MYRYSLALALLVASLLPAVLHAGADSKVTREQQRQTFQQAEDALSRGDLKTFRALNGQLADYPLQPYLDYAYLKSRLSRAGTGDVAAFLERNAGTPLEWLLRARWLNHLARQGRWQDYLAFYTQDSSTERRCHYLRALIRTGKRAEALPQVEAIWLHGRSRPKACDPVFKAWEEAGLRTDELTWKRFALAMNAGQLRLARYLARQLPVAEQAWTSRWIRLYRHPAQSLDRLDRFAQAHPYREAMLSQGVRRLARRDPVKAVKRWQQLQNTYNFPIKLVRKTNRRLSFSLVREDDPVAYRFLSSIQACSDDSRLQEARIRAALLRQDWQQVLTWVAQMPARERDKDRWRYWEARAQEMTGRADTAREAYTRLAQSRSYYGFLAADRVGAEYAIGHRPTPVEPAELARVRALPGIRRATELFALERWVDGRREWHHATLDMHDAALMAAARVAFENDLSDQAIFTLARSEYWDDLELRFPIKHSTTIQQEAQRQGLYEPFVYAVVRQESAFMPEARSPAGALGLMQLMPRTASEVARKRLQRKPPRRSELFDPLTNIALGSAYLRQMVDRFNGNNVLAIAAYNAGPHRVERWLPQLQLPADIWIELIPFRETRGYVRRVLAYKAIYQSRLGLKPQRLQQLMSSIPPSA